MEFGHLEGVPQPHLGDNNDQTMVIIHVAKSWGPILQVVNQKRCGYLLGPNPLLKGSNNGGVKQRPGALHPKG